MTDKIDITVDMRGTSKIPKMIKDWQSKHPRLAKMFNIIFVNNQQFDVVAWKDGYATHLFELKLEDDLPNSLNNGQLEKEMNEYFQYMVDLPDENTCNIYMIAGGIYDPLIYARLIGMMSSKYPWVEFHTPTRGDKMIDKVFDLIRNTKETDVTLPVLTDKGIDKGYILSIASLMNGISVPLAEYMAERIHFQMTEGELLHIINSYYNDGKNYTKLTRKIMDKLFDTWWNVNPPISIVGEIEDDEETNN